METGFSLDRSKHIAALNLTFEEYSHVSGAKHFHLANSNAENVFMVAFRTVPQDSKGVAHILEHTALCGSEKFPVRDPFFLMIRRSLNTFMNAFTTSDYTAYPFATQNKKDYFNLVEVYLDAVFFSRLDPLDFAQEGHRVEYVDPTNMDSALVHKGVVYNEMKGDTSSPNSILYQGIKEVLYPTSTYHFNSGGDPVAIPSLSYEELRAFYDSHYHPSNALFMTFGDLSATTIQEKIASLALDRLDPHVAAPIRVLPEARYEQPVTKELFYPVDEEDISKKTHIVIAWLLGKNTDLKMLLRCHLLSDVLLDTSASPLRQALEKTDLAIAASPMCGFEEESMEMNFMCGVEGSEPEHADEVEKLVLGVLSDVAEHGVAEERLEAVLHQLELSQREIGGDGWPYGLQLIFSFMSAAVHRGDPIGLLDLDSELQELREEIKDPDFIKGLVRELLLENSHRVKVVMRPDRELGARLIEDEHRNLEVLRTSLSEAEKSNVIEMTKALNERQSEKEDLSVLPQVTRVDIPASKKFPVLKTSLLTRGSAESKGLKHLKLTAASAGTNGITYHQVVSPLPRLSKELMGLLPIYTQLVTEVGSGERDYFETQEAQHSKTGGITAFASLRTSRTKCDDGAGFVTISSRTLNPKAIEMARLVKATVDIPRFDEGIRVKELVKQLSSRRSNSVASNGHQYAMSAAAAALRPVAEVSDFLTGIPSIMRLKKLALAIDDDETLQQLLLSLRKLHEQLRSNSPELLVITESDFLRTFTESMADLWGESSQIYASLFNFASFENRRDSAFVVTTQVNHCATAYATVPESNEEAAALSVLAGVLRNNFLHSEVREKGGAYGGGAGHDSANGVFRFYSYRDPRLIETFESFSRSIEWVLENEISDAMIDESVLAIISSIDSPASPAGEIRQSYHHGLFGRTAEYREESRQRYLSIRAHDLKSVANKYLNKEPSKAVVTSENRLGEVEKLFETVFVNELD